MEIQCERKSGLGMKDFNYDQIVIKTDTKRYVFGFYPIKYWGWCFSFSNGYINLPFADIYWG